MQAVYKIRVPRIVWLWLLLITALGLLILGMSQSWHVLTALGAVAFVAYAYLNGQPANARTHTGMVNQINPATGLQIIPGTHTDGGGHYSGSSR